MHTAADKETIERKLRIYAWPFKAARGLDFFAKPTPEGLVVLRTAIIQDLSRFLPPEIMAVHQTDDFSSFLDALRELFVELQQAKVVLP